MQPGISRATIGGIIGFFVGAAVVIALRVGFNFTPYWNTGLILTMGILTTAVGFVWGIGGFNPTMSEHPDDGVPPPTVEEMAEKSGPAGVLSSTMWQVTFAVLIIMAIFIALAVIPGVGLSITREATGSVRDITGTVTVPLFGEDTQIPQAFLLLGVVAFIMLSLAVAGAGLSFIFFALNRGAEKAKATPAPDPAAPRDHNNAFLRRAGDFAGQLAERLETKDTDQETAVVVKKD